MPRVAKIHSGFRLAKELVAAIAAVAKANNVTNTEVVEKWLSERARQARWGE